MRAASSVLRDENSALRAEGAATRTENARLAAQLQQAELQQAELQQAELQWAAAGAASRGRHCHSTLSLNAIVCHSLGICTLILLSLLSFSVKMTASPSAKPAWPQDCGEKGVRLAQKMQVCPRIPVGIRLGKG